jgi:ribosomal protein S24E
MKKFTTEEIKTIKIYDTNKQIEKIEADLILMKEHNIATIELKEMELEICKNTLTFLNTL